MCLGIPGRIIQIGEEQDELTMGRVSFGGLVKEVCLSYVPEAKIGDYVIVHVGFALNKIDEQEAAKVFEYLEQMGETDELENEP